MSNLISVGGLQLLRNRFEHLTTAVAPIIIFAFGKNVQRSKCVTLSFNIDMYFCMFLCDVVRKVETTEKGTLLICTPWDRYAWITCPSG